MTPEGRTILNREGNIYDTAAEKRLFIARVSYLRGEGGAELFNEFTPRRAALAGNELAAYDAEVEKVMNHLREVGVYTRNTDVVGAFVIGGLEPMPLQLDESMLYMVATAVVESYGASSDKIDTMLAEVDERWILSIDNADGMATGNGGGTGTSAGYYSASTSEFQVSLESFVDDYSKPDAISIFTHEVAHTLDYADGTLDGIPSGLSWENTQILRAERAELFAAAYPGETIVLPLLGEDLDTSTVVDSSGIRDYAYTNEREFWAVISGQFLSSDAGAEQIKNASPELYNLLREYYGRDDLPEARIISLPGKPGWPA